MFGCLAGAVVVMISPAITSKLLYADLGQRQYYRIISPIFLHFGLLHLVFNCLWLGLLGSKKKFLRAQFICY